MSNPFSILASLNSGTFASPIANRSDETSGEVLGNELSNIVQGIPLVGGGIDALSSSLESAISGLQNLMTNPTSLLSTTLQELKVRAIINNFFDGVDGLVKTGSFKGMVGKGNGIPTKLPKVPNKGAVAQGVIREDAVYAKTSDSKLVGGINSSKSDSSIHLHKGHGYTYDSQGNATSSLETTELGKSERYPSYASMKDFFKTTIGTNFYWGIKVSIPTNQSYSDLPKPVFCDSSKTQSQGNGSYFNGWLPAQTYQYSEYVSAESEEVQSLAFNFTFPSGYKIGNKLTTTLIETDRNEVSEWLEAYRAYTCPRPNVVLPYKKCVYELTIYTYRPSGELIRRYPLYVLPEVTQVLEGENDASATHPQITWLVVGRGPSSTVEEKSLVLASNNSILSRLGQ